LTPKSTHESQHFTAVEPVRGYRAMYVCELCIHVIFILLMPW